MTLKEAKKILEKEFVEIVFHKSTEPFEFDESRWFVGEKPEVLDAFRVLSKEGYYIAISGHDYDMRKARLGRPTDKPSSDTPSTLNPALKEAASQFNDALLDEQGKKIKRLGKEISKLNSIIHDKNAVLSDVAEELRLTKIREKDLTEVCEKYMKENEELKKELADKVVDKIDAQALKSAESALAWKEKVVTYKDMALAYYEKKITEKDEVIDDLGKELEATKNELEEKNYLIDMLRNSSREYCEYGVAAEKMIQKMAKVIVNESTISSKDFKNYRHWANGYRFSPLLPEFCDEEQMNLQEEALKKCNTSEDNHPTEDNSEEVEMEEILEHVREVLEKGGTVTTSYDKAEEGGDKSATIVQHGNSIANLFKEIKRLWQ